MGYAYIHQDLDSISAYLNHTTGVYMHTLTVWWYKKQREYVFMLFFENKIYVYDDRRMEYAYICQDLDSISAYLNHTIRSICAYIHVWRYTKQREYIFRLFLTIIHVWRYTKQREYVFRLFLTIKYMYMMIGAASRGRKLQLMTFDMMICSLMLKSDLKLVVKKNQCLKILMESESIISTT